MAMARTKRSGVVRPSLFWFLLLDGSLLALIKLAVSKTSYDKVNDMAGDALPPRETLQALTIGALGLHLFEALVAGRMAKRRGAFSQALGKGERVSSAPRSSISWVAISSTRSCLLRNRQ